MYVCLCCICASQNLKSPTPTRSVRQVWFIDAETGIPIKDANITVDNVGTFKTDKDGLIYFETPRDGDYSFSFQKSGYASLDDTFEVVFGSIFFNRYSIPKILELENVKLVLDWGDRPYDLDLHLVKRGSNGYHISYRSKRRLDDGTVWLDRDDMDGYGPETITITENDNAANYLVYVHNYSDGNNPNSSTHKPQRYPALTPPHLQGHFGTSDPICSGGHLYFIQTKLCWSCSLTV